jgi:maleylpyruvate isomerase
VRPHLVLHGYWRSSSAYRVRIALELKGLAYEHAPVNLLAGAQREEAHRARNPSAYVPALEVDGTTLVESMAILEWLEEAFPTPPLLPREPLERAHVRALAEIVNSGTQPLQNLWVLNHFFGADQAAKGAWAKQVITRGLAAFEALLDRHASAGPFCAGDAPSFADVLLVPQLYNARRFGVDLTAYPRALRADAACAALPAFERAHPDAQPDAKP